MEDELCLRLGLAYGLNFAELVVAAAMPCSAARVRSKACNLNAVAFIRFSHSTIGAEHRPTEIQIDGTRYEPAFPVQSRAGDDLHSRACYADHGGQAWPTKGFESG